MYDLVDFSDDIVEANAMYESVSGNPHILGSLKGTFFVPGGASRNKRLYTEGLWENVLGRNSVKKALRDGSMIGTMLHPTDESKAHPIHASHVVKSLKATSKSLAGGGKQGYGEAFLLNTPVGRIVETFQKSGLIKLYVSSRAWGKFEDGKKHEGMPVVDEKNYVLKSFDVVLEPGFLQAAPQFGEQLEQLEECYFSNLENLDMPKIERESRAKLLLRDIDLLK